MKRPETPVEIAFDNWLHDAVPNNGTGDDIYGNSENSVTMYSFEVREMLAAAFEAGWDAGEEA